MGEGRRERGGIPRVKKRNSQLHRATNICGLKNAEKSMEGGRTGPQYKKGGGRQVCPAEKRLGKDGSTNWQRRPGGESEGEGTPLRRAEKPTPQTFGYKRKASLNSCNTKNPHRGDSLLETSMGLGKRINSSDRPVWRKERGGVKARRKTH